MRKGVKLKLNINKGFTLVELLVVLVLMTILFSIAIFGALGWIDWARFKHEESAAEDIFYAVQNQLTELDSSGAFDRVMQEYLWDSNATTKAYYESEADENYVKGNYGSNYILAQGKETVQIGGDLFNSSTGIQNSDGTYYEWDKLWKDKNLKNQKRTIIKLVVDAGRYDVFVAETLPAGKQPLSSGEKLLFNLIAPYISDKSVLNGAIAIEFSPEAAQVFSVCYSDQKNSLSYEDNPGDGSVSIKDRRLQTRESRMLGYFGVDTLTSKVRGRSKSINGYRLEIINNNTLNLRLGSSTGSTNVLSGSKLTYRIYGALKYNNDNLSYPQVMSFTIEKEDVDKILEGEKGLENYTEVSAKVKFEDGIYAGSSDKSFRFPMWSDKNGNIYIALDAADIQAQSLTYAESLGFIDESNSDKIDAQKQFINTFSFYRFGLPNVRFIRAEVDVEKTVDGDTTSGTAKSGAENDEGKFIEHSMEGDALRGSAVTFADPQKDDNKNDDDKDAQFESFVYGIENGRHLYNVRFESDYGDDLDKYLKDNNCVTKDVKKTFVLRKDIDWDVFTGKAEDEHNVKQNFFFNSYIEGAHTAEEYNGCLKAGINVLAGNDPETGINRYELASVENNNTADYPFPGFRMLSFDDTFTQEQDITDLEKEDGSKADYYKLNNINISLAANYIYGVYGKTLQTEIDTINVNNNYDFSSVNLYGKAGSVPIGLFAENCGTINNIELDNIIVNGVEGYPINNPVGFVFASKVGGLVGENFGTVEKIYIDEYKRYDTNSPKYKSAINGYSDVGGIVGHQYYKIVKGNNPSSQDVKIQKCINNANVYGVSYVGGIIGRIYPTVVSGDSSDLFDSNYTIADTTKRFSRRYIEPSTIIDSDSYGFVWADIGSFTIDSCKNRGIISMNPLFVKNIIDGNSLHRGFYFGGITGAAFNNVNYENDSSFSEYTHNDENTQNVVISNCDSCQLYDVDSELKIILDPLESDSDQMLDSKTRLRATFVGGIVGGSRYGYIINCSTTPNDEDDSDKVSFVFGDRYVGGVAGYSFETDYTYDDSYRTQELNKIENGADILAETGHDYNMINGTGAFGNYAVGGIAGCFGTPVTGDVNQNFVQEVLESGFFDEDKYDYPVNAGFVKGSKIDSLLNTSIVLGCSFNSTINSIGGGPSDDNAQVGRYYYGVGGIAGVLATTIDSCDFVQSETTKQLNLELINFDTNLSYTNVTSLDTLFADADGDAMVNLKELINKSQFATDGVGGIAGHAIYGGNINAKFNGVKFKSQVDAIVFGRNRVGGAVGDTVAYSEGKSRIANIVPSKTVSGSTGMYVIGYENVGGLIGAYSDNGKKSSEHSFNSSVDYDNAVLNSQYHVLGYRAVGGAIGTFYKYKSAKESDKDKRETINININTGSEDNKTWVKGSMYVGGIVGIQESYDNESTKYSEVDRYIATLSYTKIDADCFAGAIAGAIFSSDNYYWPVNKIVSSGKIGARVFVQSDIAASFLSGIYAYNNYPKDSSHMFNTGDMSVLVNKSGSEDFNSNYKVYNDGNGIASYNGIFNLYEIRDFEYLSTGLMNNVNKIKETFDAYQNFENESDRPVYSGVAEQDDDGVKYMNMWKLTNDIQEGSSKHCFCIAKICSGGFAGYVPNNTFIKLKKYKNRSVLRTYEYINSKEAGLKDTETKYSYLGAVSGKIPVGMTVKNCWNTSEEYVDPTGSAADNANYSKSDPNPTGQTGYYDSKEATYKGGVTEVNAGIIVGNITSEQSQIAQFNHYIEFNKGKGAFAGVNGTKDTDGENSGVIIGCNNNNDSKKKMELKAIIVGGMAAVAGGSSRIEGCINNTKHTVVTDNGNEMAGGILGGVMECLSDPDNNPGKTISIVLKDNCNNASINVKKSNNSNDNSSHTAGIVYDSQGLVDIELCRNYSDGFKYAITSTEEGKTAELIKYCLDASNITNNAYENVFNRTSQFGSVNEDLPSSNMYANFYIGDKPTDNTPCLDVSKSDVFIANQYYATVNTLTSNSNIIDSIEYGSKTRIDKNVLGDVDDHEAGKWKKSEESNKKLTFELVPVRSTGESQSVYADVDGYKINWGKSTENTTASISYKLMIYDVSGNYISTSASNVSISTNDLSSTVNISALKNVEYGNNNLVSSVSDVVSDGDVDIYKNGSFDADKISKIIVVIDDASFTTESNNDSENENSSENNSSNVPNNNEDNNSGENNSSSEQSPENSINPEVNSTPENNGENSNNENSGEGTEGENAGTGVLFDEAIEDAQPETFEVNDGLIDEADSKEEDEDDEVASETKEVRGEGEESPDVEFISVGIFTWKENGKDSYSSMNSAKDAQELIENPFANTTSMKNLFGILENKYVSLTKLYKLGDENMNICLAIDDYKTGMTGRIKDANTLYDFEAIDSEYKSFINSMTH